MVELGIVDIPKGKSGKFGITHRLYREGDEFTVVSLRTAIMTGQKPTRTIATQDGVIHELREKGNVWMTDAPCESYQHMRFVPKLFGNVLVGGLGLGLICKMIARSKDVSKVVVVEKSKNVIDLVWKYSKFDKRFSVVNDDLFEFLKNGCGKFDCAYYDIWSGDGETDYHEYVVPLKRLSRGKIPIENIHCWQEDVMIGQVNKSF